MDASDVAQLILVLSQKKPLTGYESMMYMSLCELMETITRRMNKNLRKDLDEPDNASD